MEPILKTRFPLSKQVVSSDIFSIVSKWMSLNRNFNAASFDPKVLQSIVNDDNFSIEGKNHTLIEKVTVDTDPVIYTSFCFTHPITNPGEFFENQICIRQDSETKNTLATMIQSYGNNDPGHKDIECKKPVILNMLIDNLPAFGDTWLTLKTTPHVLLEADAIPIAESINCEVNQTLLPLVYVSRTNSDNDFALNPLLLAKKLGGVAHVIVTPSNQFSDEVKSYLKNKDNGCYNGAVRVYWPKNLNRHANRFWSQDEILNTIQDSNPQDIYQDIFLYIINKTKSMTMRDCNHEYVSVLAKKKQIHDRMVSLQSKVYESEAKEKQNAEVVTLYEQVITQLESEKNGLSNQVQKLSDELDDVKDSLEAARSNLVHANQNRASCVKLQIDIPSDLLLILDSFYKKLGSSVAPYYRERVKEFLDSNSRGFDQAIQERDLAIEDLSNAFNAYTRLNAHHVKMLHKHKLTYTEDGSHYKVYKEGFNPDICVSLPKTPSDHRSGKNFITSIRKTFYNL